MNIRFFGNSDPGLVRPNNEDALFIDEANRVFAVADGLGGLPGGAQASQRIVELLDETFGGIDAEEERPDLGELVIQINRIVAFEGMNDHPYTGSGSTLTAGQIVEDQLLIAHVGDSAAYLLHADSFNKLTIDHTMEQELVDRAGESARATMPPEYPHTLTRCIGQTDELRVDQNRIKLEVGDRLLFCSDGLNKVLSNEDIRKLLVASEDPEKICTTLIDTANSRKGPDNITVIVILIDS
ncbi:MAG: serine/threonine-protein phosphatase [Coraliomargarita sp.]|nr:serine/threonine-protein phosphatase [Coraliomargarita sp.]